MNILKEADKLVNGSRQKDYDHPTQNFRRIALLWDAYFKAKGSIQIVAEDVPILNILQKIAREMHRHKPDNMVDIAGYAQTVEMLYDTEGK